MVQRQGGGVTFNVHPLDAEISEMAETRAVLLRVLSRDGEVSAEELAVLSRYDNHVSDVSVYRKRQFAAEAFERNGCTRTVKHDFVDAGFRLVDLARERQRPKVTDLAAERQKRRSNVVVFRGHGEPQDIA